MSYADGLLSTGERIIHRSKQHPLIFLWGARWTILAIVLATVLLWISSAMDGEGLSGSVRSVLVWVILIMYVGGIGVFAWTALRYVNQEYVLTNRRVIQVEGVLNRSATDSSLEKINDAVLSQSIFGRMFDFGDLRVLTAAEAGIENFRMIRGPITFKKKMLDAKHEYEVDMERAGIPPSPPIRQPAVADAPPSGAGGAAAAGVGASASDDLDETKAVNTDLSPDEVTRTLNNLADLRDRGAITSAEYEAKKAELLGRL
jgi:Bacterial PH domain/Short C-terminal domain